MFGMGVQLMCQIGPGLGAFSVKRREGRDLREGCDMVAEKAYCAAWVHFLKAQGMPLDSRFFTNQSKIFMVLEILASSGFNQSPL